MRNLTFSAGDRDPINELMLSMIDVFAQFERSALKERQAARVENARDRPKLNIQNQG